MAFGGKRENGARKIELKPELGAAGEVDVVRGEWEGNKEKNVKKTTATKKEKARSVRGSRMVGIEDRNKLRGRSTL